MKINKKLILIFSLISLLPVILVAFVSVYSFQKGMKNTIGRELESLAREKAGTISLYYYVYINI
jgi:nitrogen fixation/metabolism regulation signal transduction histidine kinase